jgi:hypothetical protein
MPSYALIKYKPPLPPSLCTWREGGTESTGGVGRQEPPVRSRMLTAGNWTIHEKLSKHMRRFTDLF